jgi:HemK-related putative methylase
MSVSFFIKIKQPAAAWLIKKIQKYGPHKVRVSGRMYEISENVFNPRFYYTSEFMARHIIVSFQDSVLDIGTGSGIQAITAGQRASSVVAVDINPEAVSFACRNVKAHGLEDVISVIEGDLFSTLEPCTAFNVILFTPPYLEGRPDTVFDHALFDHDKALIRRFFKEAKTYLKPAGYVQMLYSSIADPEGTLKIAADLGWDHKLVVSQKTGTEHFLIYRLRPQE